MSTTIDQRVVEMQFDNKQFENGVQTTLSTLDKLKQSLNLTGASKGLENVSSAAGKVNLSGLGNAVETVHAKFSAMEVMAVTALANITNSAVNAGKRIVSALTIDPIKTGFAEYETQINAVQTILANTSHNGTTIEDVNKVLDELNHYADMTIYNFTEMTRNIGTFTAAGLGLEESASAIKGIANLAAVSGSTSAQASNAMYQLSQALANGKVNLQDWNSVVNAGMGGKVFQDALVRTAAAMKGVTEETFRAQNITGSFRESISSRDGKGWLTADVLSKTLQQFTGDLTDAELAAMGFTEEQIKNIQTMAQTANNAATKVKTFTQLWDTLKEAAQSGWTQSWEIIVGDFEEAKAFLTDISDTISGVLNNSAQARNDLLQGWKDLGGRTDLIDGLWNAFNGMAAIITPIKEAFRDIFPPTTSKQLAAFTEGFKNLTQRFEDFADKHGDQIYSTFKGIFSVLKIGVDVVKDIAGGAVTLIKNFTGISGSILDVTASFGDWLTNMSESVRKTDIFGKAIEKVVGFLSNIITKIKEFGIAARDSFKTPGFQGFLGFFEKLWDFIKLIGSKAGEMLSPIGDALSRAFGDSNLFDILNSGLLAGIFVGMQSFSGGFGKLFDKFKGLIDDLNDGDGFFGNIKGAFEDLRGCFESYQNSLNAETLMKIAKAIALLAGSIFVLSTIDAEALDRSVGYLSVLFAELLGSLFLFTKMDVGGMKGITKACGVMTAMSVSVLILSGALKVLASIEPKGLINGLIAIGALMAEIALFLNGANFSGKTMGTAVGIVILSSAMLILAKAVEDFGAMDWSTIGKGLAAIGALLLELGLFTKLTGSAKHVVSTGAAMVLLGAAMKIFVSVLNDLGSMSWDTLTKGLFGMGAALLELSIAMRLMPKNTILIGVGLLAVGGAMKVVANALSDFGGMSWDALTKGLFGMGAALLELAIGLKMMNGSLAGAAALVIAAGALAIITPVMKALGGMSWESIGKGLVTLAGAFAVIGIAGLALGPMIPTILGLAGAFTLFGLSVAAIGAGIALLSVGLTGLATAGAAGAAAIVAALTIIIVGIIDLIPTIVGKLGELILAVCKVIGECAPQIALTVLNVISEILGALATYTPQIIDSLMIFLIGLIDGLAEHMPQLITSAMNLIGSFFQGVADALSGMDTTSLFKGVIGIGLMTGLMMALSAVVSFIPGAMIGVIGMGAVVAELAIVLAAIGALAQIPGLHWLIGEGGELLEGIGNAIGKFVGGIVGGAMEGITSSLPKIGSDLSNFMTNASPFIEGAKSIDTSMMEGVRALADTILVLTAADILSGIASWITGGSSLTDFATQLVPFGEAMKSYSDKVVGINSAAVVASAAAGKALAELADNLPNSGGIVSWFTGNNDIDDFAKKLIPFGKAMKSYSDKVVGINASAVVASATAGKALNELAKTLPNSGGIVSWFTGNNDIDDFGDGLVSFGKALKEYSDKVVGMNSAAVNTSVTVAKKLVSLIESMAGLNANGVNTFALALSTLGRTSVDSFVKSFSSAPTKLTKIGSDLANALVKGFNSKKNTIINTINKLLNDVLNNIKNKNTSFSNAGTSLMTRFVSGINSQKSNVTRTISSMLSSAVSTMMGYYNSFYSAGSYLVDGFANGISANRFKAKAQAVAMADAALQGAKEALDENSPSKEFYNVGDFAGLGFVNALKDYVSVSYTAGSKMANSAKEGLSNAINKVKDVLDGNVDVQPTIRPVLDLSGVSKGARMLNDIFSTPSIVTASNIRAIGSISSNNNQNGSNKDVVSAIKDLKNGFKSGDTYILDGITYDDGSNVSEALKTLVRAARMERRV